MNPDIRGFFDKATNTISYIVSDPVTRAAAIIDPVLDFSPNDAHVSTSSADALLGVLDTEKLDLLYLLETHAHADHLSAAHHLRELTGVPIVIGRHITQVQALFAPMFEAEDVATNGSAFDKLLDEGDQLPLGDLTIRVMHTPGHTPACVTYLVGNAAFIGDTLFMPDYGTARADFPGGDATALYRSIQRILDLPPETRLFTGHDYSPLGRTDVEWESSVADQRTDNIHVHDGVTESAFAAMRDARDLTLSKPKLILPSLQVNIRAGKMPPASPAGQVFLRLPVNRI